MPIRHGGRLASRISTWLRDHFCRSTMAPRRSWPTTWNEFLPISMPITATEVLSVSDMACSLSWAPLASFARWWGRSTAGPFHYRSAPGSWQRIGGGSPPRGRFSQPPRPRVMHEVLLARAAMKRSQGRPRAKWIPSFPTTLCSSRNSSNKSSPSGAGAWPNFLRPPPTK